MSVGELASAKRVPWKKAKQKTAELIILNANFLSAL
jgi:hypothetical protein